MERTPRPAWRYATPSGTKLACLPTAAAFGIPQQRTRGTGPGPRNATGRAAPAAPAVTASAVTDLDELVCVVAAAGFVAVALTPRGRVLVRPDHPDAWPRLTTLTARLAARWPHLEALPADVAAHAPPGSDLAAARPLAGSAPTPPV